MTFLGSVVLAGCCYNPASEGWHATVPEGAPPEAQPLIAILRTVERELYGRKKAEILWDERLSYLDLAVTEETRKMYREVIGDYPGATFQWRDVEFFETGEFARVEVRAVRPHYVTMGRNPRGGGIHFEGSCLFRKFPEGWRVKNSFPAASQQGIGSWEALVMTEVSSGVWRAQDCRKEAAPAPAWATDSEILRILKLGLTLYERRRLFPLAAVLTLFFSDVLPVRRFAYETIVQTFKADFGYSEQRLLPEDPQSGAWFKGWQKWIDRTYPQGSEAVPLP